MPGNTRVPAQAPGSLELGLAGLLAGTALQIGQPQLWRQEAYALALGVAVALALVVRALGRRGSALRMQSLLAWAFAAGLAAWGLTGSRAWVYQSHALEPRLEGRDILVTGVVSEMPQFNEAGIRFRLKVESALLDGSAVRLPEVLALGWYSGSLGPAADGLVAELQRQPAALQAGERWRMAVRLKAPHGNSNPFGFDYELWLWDQGVQATGYVRSGASDPVAENLGPTGLYPVARVRQAARDRILATLVHSGEAGVVAALVVGDQNAIDRADWDVFRATGVAHLMSISGLHVTMFAWVAAALVGRLWRCSGSLCLRLPAPHAAHIGGLALAAAYAVFSGWGVPAQRTVWMLAVVVLLQLSARRWPWPTVWLLVGAAVVLIDPWALTQAGFWLSFIAVGVLFVSGTAAPKPGGSRMGRQLQALLREQVVVSVSLAPLTLLLFGQVSLVGLVANLLAIPWVTLLVTPLAMAGLVVPSAWQLASWCVGLLGHWLEWLSGWPWAAVSLPQAPAWAALAAVCGGVLLVLQAPWSLRLMGGALVLPVLLWQPPSLAPGEFSLLAADVGQGNAVLVRTRNHALLYDAGPRYSRESDAGHRVLVPLLRALGVRLDMLVVSHRDSDHAGGAASVLAAHPEATLLSSMEADDIPQGALRSMRCQAGQGWTWDGVSFTVLHPEAADYPAVGRPNAVSCVLRVATQPRDGALPARAALLTGDIERPQELRLVARGLPLQADVLLVPHHGSRTSSSAEFLDAVGPQWALVQSGYRNRFGHPAAAPLARYGERHIAVRDSPRCGAALWQSDRPSVVRCHRDEARRYWHHVAP